MGEPRSSTAPTALPYLLPNVTSNSSNGDIAHDYMMVGDNKRTLQDSQGNLYTSNGAAVGNSNGDNKKAKKQRRRPSPVSGGGSSTSELYLVQASDEPIDSFRDQDVLSGRGGGTNAHPGNRHFRDLINEHRRSYLKARKNDKPAISRAIVKKVRDSGGRFLKKQGSYWVEIGDFAAREKTSQALRQRAPEMRQLMFQVDNGMTPNAALIGTAGSTGAAAAAAIVNATPTVSRESSAASSAPAPAAPTSTAQVVMSMPPTHQDHSHNAHSHGGHPQQHQHVLVYGGHLGGQPQPQQTYTTVAAPAAPTPAPGVVHHHHQQHLHAVADHKEPPQQNQSLVHALGTSSSTEPPAMSHHDAAQVITRMTSAHSQQQQQHQSYTEAAPQYQHHDQYHHDQHHQQAAAPAPTSTFQV